MRPTPRRCGRSPASPRLATTIRARAARRLPWPATTRSVENCDTDWYAVALAAPATLRVETRVVGKTTCASTIVDASIVDAGGALVAAPGAAGPDPRSCAIVTAALPAGRSYVRVDGRPAPADYELVVTTAP